VIEADTILDTIRRQLTTLRLSTEAIARCRQKELALRAENEELKQEIAWLKTRLEELTASECGSNNGNLVATATPAHALLTPSDAGKFGEGA